ncbi:MAG: hypothetical protein RLZZ54_1402 [Cyanobacteriota bacterium]|jgi:hypothetical protein
MRTLIHRGPISWGHVRGTKSKDKEEGQAKEAELLQQYCFAEA